MLCRSAGQSKCQDLCSRGKEVGYDEVCYLFNAINTYPDRLFVLLIRPWDGAHVSLNEKGTGSLLLICIEVCTPVLFSTFSQLTTALHAVIISSTTGPYPATAGTCQTTTSPFTTCRRTSMSKAFRTAPFLGQPTSPHCTQAEPLSAPNAARARCSAVKTSSMVSTCSMQRTLRKPSACKGA